MGKHSITRLFGSTYTRLTPAIAALVCGAAASAADVQPDARMLRFPTVSGSQIAFVFANNIWVVPRAGGVASPVAAPPGQALYPRFSPDGKTIAFTANYDGNRDIYTVPTDGGVPLRVTHNPATETLSGWADADDLLFFSAGMADRPTRTTQMFTVSATGGLPAKAPLPYGSFASLSSDGRWLAYTPNSTDNRTWKRYRGGMATDVWLFDLQEKLSRRITDWEGTDTLPMWGLNGSAKTVYYLSDAGPEHRLNVWSFDTESGSRAQITTFADDDVRWPNLGPSEPGNAGGKGAIVFQLGSQLMLLDLNTNQSREVPVRIPGARPAIRPQIEDAARNISAFNISPNGKRVLLVGRGDLWSLPAKEGVPRNLTRTNGAFERDAAWSPDGKWIAYLSDQSGEYELWLRPSDAQWAEADKPADAKPEKKDDAKADGAKAGDAKPGDKAEAKRTGPREPVKLTSMGAGFRANLTWSPDSKHVMLTDEAGKLIMVTIALEGETAAATVKTIDTDPLAQPMNFSWSHDSSWLAYSRADESSQNGAIWIYKLDTGEKTRVTDPIFAASSPTFDRKGDYLFYRSAHNFARPQYADADTTFIYAGTERLMMVPLRADVKNPMAPVSDEEELGKDGKLRSGGAGGAPARDSGGDGSGAPAPGSGQPARRPGRRAGEVFDPPADEKPDAPEAEKKPENDGDKNEKKDEPKKPAEKKKDLVIELNGFEERALVLPVDAGNFGSLNVTDDGKLVYIRRGALDEDGEPERTSIKVFDPKSEKKEEETVSADGGAFVFSANGKKLLVQRAGGPGGGGGGGGGVGGGRRYVILDPVAGGGKAQDVSTSGMRIEIDPRVEWKQIFNDAWRLQRDLFYVENMHGVDWPKMREHYGKMLDDAASREDVQFILGELISELNIGHAYMQNPGDVEAGPNLSVGMLGCDFELVGKPGQPGSAYRVTRIYEGASFDADARGPLSQPGPKDKRVNTGDFILAVNGVAIDTTQDPWAAFLGMAGAPTTLTVNDKPAMDGSRDVIVKPIANDSALRFRFWIERNREYVEQKSGGKVGYIYVPNTGVDGQNELFRQFFGQRGKAALIIDERWNGGGQIPTRFIELLNRPRVNYWARRHGIDWAWPPDSHQGPKCMLINGLAGSGGDMFPWLFKHNQIGKVIGTRTWGGLVGITGNPAFIDGGSMTVPTFGFYEKDGTWGIEGHGVDPDMVVIDDPGKMHDGLGQPADPQLDAAIEHMLAEIKANPYSPPARPAAPDRSGMGLPERDR